jgi:hypothetical protein
MSRRVLACVGLLAACAADDRPASTSANAGGQAGTDAGVSTGGGSGGLPDAASPAPVGPTRYPGDAVFSPVTQAVADRLRSIAEKNTRPKNDVFIKVGDSHSVSQHFLHCFAGEPPYQLDLDGRDALLASIEFFRAGPAAGTTPFDRNSLAASVGKSANWPLAGSPTPLSEELTATNPRFAFVSFGSNDMQFGLSFESAIFPFYRNMMAIFDALEEKGVVPIVTGLPPRGDPTAALWAETYDAATRGMAEARQIPYFSVYLANKDLPEQGLVSDGLHENVYVASTPQPCVFSPAALEYGYNVRNLRSLERLDVVKRVVIDRQLPPDSPPAALEGEGTAQAPFVIDTLPFTHFADTSTGEKTIAAYPGCNATQDESGPERFYSFTLREATTVRILLFDRSGVDVDLHLLSGARSGESCVARADRSIQRTLAAGTHTIVVDTFTSDGSEHSGAYLLLLVRCEAGDSECE